MSFITFMARENLLRVLETCSSSGLLVLPEVLRAHEGNLIFFIETSESKIAVRERTNGRCDKEVRYFPMPLHNTILQSSVGDMRVFHWLQYPSLCSPVLGMVDCSLLLIPLTTLDSYRPGPLFFHQLFSGKPLAFIVLLEDDCTDAEALLQQILKVLDLIRSWCLLAGQSPERYLQYGLSVWKTTTQNSSVFISYSELLSEHLHACLDKLWNCSDNHNPGGLVKHLWNLPSTQSMESKQNVAQNFFHASCSMEIQSLLFHMDPQKRFVARMITSNTRYSAVRVLSGSYNSRDWNSLCFVTEDLQILEVTGPLQFILSSGLVYDNRGFQCEQLKAGDMAMTTAYAPNHDILFIIHSSLAPMFTSNQVKETPPLVYSVAAVPRVHSEYTPHKRCYQWLVIHKDANNSRGFWNPFDIVKVQEIPADFPPFSDIKNLQYSVIPYVN